MYCRCWFSYFFLQFLKAEIYLNQYCRAWISILYSPGLISRKIWVRLKFHTVYRREQANLKSFSTVGLKICLPTSVAEGLPVIWNRYIDEKQSKNPYWSRGDIGPNTREGQLGEALSNLPLNPQKWSNSLQQLSHFFKWRADGKSQCQVTLSKSLH